MFYKVKDRVKFNENILYPELKTDESNNQKDGQEIEGEIISYNIKLLKSDENGDDVEEDYTYDPKVGGINMKVGDRVKVDFTASFSRKGTIQDVTSNGKSYKIQYDENNDDVDHDSTGTPDLLAVENIKYNIKYIKMTGREVADELREMSNYHYEKENKTWYPRLFRVLVGEMV